MLEWNALISKSNLKLAWNRIATGRNLQHKRFFRHIYGGYELGLSENITLLHEKLKGDWEATPPTRVYLPKSSGMLRPISLLAIEDQIVLQAIANKVATHVATRRRKVEQKQVFSNCLERRDGTIFPGLAYNLLRISKATRKASENRIYLDCVFRPCCLLRNYLP
jgi:hypothetical protein